MKLESVHQFLQNKTILVTGAAGFLAKIFIEKVLRVQPDVKKLYLLLRGSDNNTVAQRFHNEIMGKDLFRVLKEKLGANFNSFMSEKVALVPGDVTLDDLGVEDPKLREEMWDQIDIIVNLAATVNFDERYDVALGVNTMGAKHALNFAKKCGKLQVFVQVSTAYVSGEREGLIEETPYPMGYTLNGVGGLDIEAEQSIVDLKLAELKAKSATEKEISWAMRDLGLQRANTYGWPNPYVFTKAMAEMSVGQLKGDLPIVIIRPTIVTSTYKQPFPGWTEGVRTVDSVALGYGTGKLKCFPCDLEAVVDTIPADMVVNCLVVAMATHANERSQVIYHIGCSLKNPIRYSNLQDYAFRYFTRNPWINKDGKAVKVGELTMLKSMASFRRYMTIRYLIWLKALELANIALCHSLNGTYTGLDRKMKFVMRLVEIYRPYLFFKGIFDDSNTEKLRTAAKGSLADMENFYFDPRDIDWDDYAINIHLPGLVKYVFK